ncbi:BLOC-1-related complex subunit 6 [Misgurnus anguillicaudatus]|uniref:BLOC-1-related complex subunit 6 n=1 Tax=Misgurnus anguillicaudatus TaxID=75329 RepID=UPI002434AEEF|nr:BLOC-1 related complex subunit 6 [Misgurnus anguillicaudatus]XP_055023783.1 BLOC-1 related complex subunit 6 [Misgurnus anguillicaudatus]
MSHSSVIGQTASNGVDTSGTPKAPDWSGPHGFNPQEIKFMDDPEFIEQDTHKGTPVLSEILKHTPCHKDSVCTHAHQSNTVLAETPPADESPHVTCTQSSETELTQARSKRDLEEWRGEEEETNRGDGEMNNINKKEIVQRKETLISVQEWSNSDSSSSSSLQDKIQPNTSVSPDEAPPLVPAPPPDQTTPPLLPDIDSSPCPAHVMAEVRVRSVPERDRVVRGMQDSKSLDEISGACGGGARGGGIKGGQAEGRRATISSALELEGTVSQEGDLTHFITKNLEQKIKMSSRPSLDTDSDCSGPVVHERGSLRRPADIPPIDPSVLVDLHKHTQDVAQSVELMLRSLNGTIQNMTALSVGYIQTYRDSVDSLGESVDMSIKGMYTLMARCEELDRSMQPIHTLAAQIRDIKRTLDALETICK